MDGGGSFIRLPHFQSSLYSKPQKCRKYPRVAQACVFSPWTRGHRPQVRDSGRNVEFLRKILCWSDVPPLDCVSCGERKDAVQIGKFGTHAQSHYITTLALYSAGDETISRWFWMLSRNKNRIFNIGALCCINIWLLNKLPRVLHSSRDARMTTGENYPRCVDCIDSCCGRWWHFTLFLITSHRDTVDISFISHKRGKVILQEPTPE